MLKRFPVLSWVIRLFLRRGRGFFLLGVFWNLYIKFNVFFRFGFVALGRNPCLFHSVYCFVYRVYKNSYVLEYFNNIAPMGSDLLIRYGVNERLRLLNIEFSLFYGVKRCPHLLFGVALKNGARVTLGQIFLFNKISDVHGKLQ